LPWLGSLNDDDSSNLPLKVTQWNAFDAGPP
jgi:hypothetical protein